MSNIQLKPIPTKTVNFIISDWDEERDNCHVCAQKSDNSKHILHKNLTFDDAVTLITHYLLKHKKERA